MEYKSPYKDIQGRKFNTWCRWSKRIDTYGCGCQHECDYCYAKALLNFRGHWGKPLLSNMGEIHYHIKKLNKGDVVRLGSMTDCFQPIERESEITFKTIKLLNHYRINYLIVTKGSLVSSQKYLNIYDKSLAHFQISITSTRDDIIYEKASLTSERIKSAEVLNGLGFDVAIRLSPLIEQNIDFETLNQIKCDKILIEFLKVNHFVKKTFNIDYSNYSLKYGGHDNLQLRDKIRIVNKITGFKQLSVGEYVADHHKYFSKNVNFNPEDCCNLTLKKMIEYKQLTLF